MENAILNQILYEGHPSLNTHRAVFMFALSSETQVSRFLLVEVENRWAVLALERILLQGGQVSDNCRVMAIFRDTISLGVRDQLVTEIPFVDFMMDIVDFERVFGDQIVRYCFGNSLTSDEKQYVMSKLEVLQGHEDEPEEPKVPISDPPKSDRHAQLLNALCSLGFKKSEVRKFVQSLGVRIERDQLHSLVREGIGALNTLST